jgi:hypothetical protein
MGRAHLYRTPIPCGTSSATSNSFVLKDGSAIRHSETPQLAKTSPPEGI